MTVDITIEEMTESLTGFDELAIAKHFGMEWMALGEAKPTSLSRALVFVHLRREGKKDGDAYQGAMSMTLREASEYFADAEDDVDPDDPTSESGKDSSGPSEQPTS